MTNSFSILRNLNQIPPDKSLAFRHLFWWYFVKYILKHKASEKELLQSRMD